MTNSNVVSIAQNNDSNSQVSRLAYLASLHSPETFYDVEVTGNYFQDNAGQLTPTGRVTLINGSTGEPLSVMSTAYNVVQNQDIFTALDRQIASIPELDLTGAYTKVDVSGGGANVAVQYIFPAHRVETAKGDATDLMITAINSFNGSSSFCIYLGGFRSYCMNSQVFGTTIVSYRKQHCKSLSIDKAASIIRSGLDVFTKEGDAWKAMSNTRVSDVKVFQALCEFGEIEGHWEGYGDYFLEVVSRSSRTTKLENYMRIYKAYEKEMGNTEFALYNTLTHIATHGSAKVGNRKQSTSSFESRSKKVAKVAIHHLIAYKMAA